MSATVVHHKSNKRHKKYDTPQQALRKDFVIAETIEYIPCPKKIKRHSNMRHLGKDISATPRKGEESHSAKIVHRQESKCQPDSIFVVQKDYKAN